VRAQLLKQFGGPENFELLDIAKPAVRPGTVLVRVAATSVNQVDVKILGGLPIGPDLPAVLGADVAGTIEEAGAGVLGFAVGDEGDEIVDLAKVNLFRYALRRVGLFG
jgi:NADPH:quinone reductase